MNSEALSILPSPESPVSLSTNGSTLKRRSFTNISVALITGQLLTLPQESQALQKKNEALCGTGFFEHIDEYKCTAIGDITDEAKSKMMDEKMENSADKLMEKLGFSDSNVQSRGSDSSDKGSKEQIFDKIRSKASN